MTTLTGAARASRDARVLTDTARHAMALRGPGIPDEVVALLTAADRVRPVRNPEPLRPEIAAALTVCPRCDGAHVDTLEPEHDLCRGCLDEVSHAAQWRQFAAAWDAGDEWGPM